MKPRLVIYGTRNGWVLEDEPDEEGYVSSESVENDDVLLLWAIADRLCSSGSRYDADRLSIGRKPGDKHHDIHPERCAACKCQCDPDQSEHTVDSTGALCPEYGT